MDGAVGNSEIQYFHKQRQVHEIILLNAVVDVKRFGYTVSAEYSIFCSGTGVPEGEQTF